MFYPASRIIAIAFVFLFPVIASTGIASESSFCTVPSPQMKPDSNAFILFVSPAGNDSWSGKLAEPNAAATDGPLVTIEKARDRIREIKAAQGGLKQPVTVLIRAGVYPQTKAIVFTPDDSGTKAYPITYQVYPGEQAVISGGQPITGWQLDDSSHSKIHCNGKLWRADIPKTTDGKRQSFNQLFVDGQRRVRARTPNKGDFFRTDGPVDKNNSRAFYFKEGDMKQWSNLRDVIAVVYHSWETSIHHIRSIDPETCLATFLETAPWPMGYWEKQQRYYVENAFEALDQPGEWYLNRKTARLYYYPLPGEKMDGIQAVAPLVPSTLVSFKGEPDKGKFIEHLNFRGLSFQHTDSNLRRLRNPGQGEIYQPAAIMAVGLRNSAIESCEVAHTGAHAIWMAAGCADNRIERCHLHDLGGGGVYIGGGWGVQDKTPVERITVDNSFIHDGSHIFHGAHGVWIGRSSYNKVIHNEISNFDYTGISCGWSWGFQPSSANHNNLDYNHIHHLSNGEGLSDMGGIYTLGISPGTTERNNHMHHIYSYAHVSHGSGIYPDEGSSQILIENNVVHHVRTCPLFQHYGKDNTVRNNILAFGGRGQLQRCREDKPCHYVAEGNIVYADIRQMLGGVWKSGDWKLGRNVYWSTAGPPVFYGMDFKDWKVKAKDEGSIVADPLFVDAENGDFRLKPGSPALKLGFKPIDLAKTGLYGDGHWVNLPKQYKDRPLNEIPAPVPRSVSINFDFEDQKPGEDPPDGSVHVCGKGSSLKISSDEAAGGQNSMKFTDAPGQTQAWMPHICYSKTYKKGKVHCSWDMLNSKENPASFYIELRDYNAVANYVIGPTVWVAPDGKVTASGKHVGTIPPGKWAHVDIDLELGPDAPKTYRFALSTPGKKTTVVELPYISDKFKELTWLGISSNSNAKTEFYIDNLKLGTAEELAKPPKRRRKKTAHKVMPAKPANNQKLMANWKFDAAEGYTAKDSSGYDNRGDVWADWVKGSFGGAILCGPSASHVVVPDSPTLQLGTSDFSIELWICPTELKIDSKDSRRRFLSKNRFPKTWMVMDITSQGRPHLEMVDSNRVGCQPKPTATIPENAWTHMAVVVDRTNAKLMYYFNGKLDSTHKIPPSFTGSMDVKGAELTVGSTWQPFVGMLDEVKIYRRTLTPAEVKSSYDNDKDRRASWEYEFVDE